MDKQSLFEMLNALCAAPGVSGDEAPAARAALPYLEGFDCALTPRAACWAAAGPTAPACCSPPTSTRSV